VNRDEAAPLIGRNLPELEGALPTIRSDCARADPGVVDEDVDAAEPGSRGFGDLIDRGVVGRIRLDGEQFGLCSGALAASASKGSRSRSTPATLMPAANRPRVIVLPMPPAAPVTIATLWISLMVYFLRFTYLYPTSDLEGEPWRSRLDVDLEAQNFAV
jgi:hypothetical protein